jgi:uncharacterized delta-60 repeat protein
MRRAIPATLAALVLVSGAAATSGGGDGSLDATFAGGTVETSVGTDGSGDIGTALQADGKVLLFGQSDYAVGQTGFTVLRYTRSGTPDPTFGVGGVVQTPIGTINDEAFAGTVAPDGKIVAAGFTYSARGPSFALVRYLSDGSLDTSFGSGGIVTTDVGDPGSQETAFSVAVQPDGKIVASGYAFSAALGNTVVAVVRYLPDGELDPTFGTGGIVKFRPYPSYAISSGMVLDGAGGILVTASPGDGFKVIRLTSSGALDPNFGSNGVATISLGSIPGTPNAAELALQPDGKIVVAGVAAFSPDVVVGRLQANGVPDTSFGTAGVAVANVGTNPANVASVRAVAVQPDGKVDVAGTLADAIFPAPQPAHQVVARFLGDGRSDTTFGNGGVASATFGLQRSVTESAALGSDGRLVVGGTTIDIPITTSDFTVAVFRTDTVAPTCAVGAPAAETGSRGSIGLTFDDTDTGLSGITTDTEAGGVLDVPVFPAGTQSGITARLTQSQAGQPALASVRGADRAGNTVVCTAGVTMLTRDKGQKSSGLQTFTDVSASTHTLTLVNGSAGLRSVTVTVNGVAIDVRSLIDSEVRTVDLSAYLTAGSGNVVQLAPAGKVGSSALVELD